MDKKAGLILPLERYDRDDECTVYLETPDGLRLIIREGKYVGWYLPGEVQ